MDKARKAKPSEADLAAAGRLKALWRAMPRDQRPTQEQLGERYGEGGSQSLISQYMNGVIPLNIRAVLFFARELNCAPEEIYPELDGLDQVVAISGNAMVLETEPQSPEDMARRRDAFNPAHRAADEKWASYSLEQKQRILELVEIAGLIAKPSSAAPTTKRRSEDDVVRHSDTAIGLRRQRKERRSAHQKRTTHSR